jgi:hypothetical protein
MSAEWKLEDVLKHTKVCDIPAFISAFQPPQCFVYYLRVFVGVFDDPSALSGMLITCFVRPLLVSPVDYGVPVHVVEAQVLRFLEALPGHPKFNEFLTCVIGCESYYGIVRTQTFEADSIAVMNEVDLGIGPFDVQPKSGVRKSVGRDASQPAEQLAARGWNWVVRVGQAAVLVMPQRMPNASAESLLEYFMSSLGGSDSVFTMVVDGKSITPSAVDKIGKFSQVSRVGQVIFVRLGFASATALQKLGASNWTQKVKIADDPESALGSDAVFLAPKYFAQPSSTALLSVTLQGIAASLGVCASGFVVSAPL